MIYMLAAAMMIAMLIGTLLGLREEGERVKVETRKRSSDGFGHRLR